MRLKHRLFADHFVDYDQMKLRKCYVPPAKTGISLEISPCLINLLYSTQERSLVLSYPLDTVKCNQTWGGDALANLSVSCFDSCFVGFILLQLTLLSSEPRHEKTNVLVSDLVRHKPGCTATEDG